MDKAERIKNLIAEQLGIEIGMVLPVAKFQDDLGADSLDLIELTMRLEEEFDIEIPDDDANNIITVGDVIKYIEERTKC